MFDYRFPRPFPPHCFPHPHHQPQKEMAGSMPACPCLALPCLLFALFLGMGEGEGEEAAAERIRGEILRGEERKECEMVRWSELPWKEWVSRG